MPRMTSPARMPGVVGRAVRADRAVASPSSPSETPRNAVARAAPSRMSCGTTRREGGRGDREADPGARPCVLTPTTRPSASTSGPPELPGLTAASVWIASGTVKPVGLADQAAGRGDDPRRRAALQAVGRADGEDGLADLDRAARGELERRVVVARARRGSIFSDGEVGACGRGRRSSPGCGASTGRSGRWRSGRASTTCAFVTRWPLASKRNAAPVATRRPLSNGGSSSVRRASIRRDRRRRRARRARAKPSGARPGTCVTAIPLAAARRRRRVTSATIASDERRATPGRGDEERVAERSCTAPRVTGRLNAP